MTKKINIIQFAVLSVLWLLLMLTPLFAMDSNEDMHKLLGIWHRHAVMFVVFLINRFVLMPQLFFRKKVSMYFIVLTALILLNVGYVYLEIMSIGEIFNLKDKITTITLHSLTFTVLIIGFDLGLSLVIRWFDLERQRTLLEKENSEVKLTLLHKQISPHFFMNMLNNIHALVDIDQERAKGSIIHLSKLMSYQLYETDSQRVSLTNEVEFINNYINLMRLRFSKRVTIESSVEGSIEGVMVPPLIFLNFIENAFKHGVSYKEVSIIRINIKRIEQHIVMTVFNTNHAKQSVNKFSGIGVENNRKRLDLIYGDRYEFDVEENNEIYRVTLKIPV